MTKGYDRLYPVDLPAKLLKETKKKAKARKVSLASIVRKAFEEFIKAA